MKPDVRRRTSLNAKSRPWGRLIWKVLGSILLGVLLFLFISRRQAVPEGLIHSTAKPQLQLSNCTTPATNVSCTCPPAPKITDAASEDGVLQLANKITSPTVSNILEAASSNDPRGQTVRVRPPMHSLLQAQWDPLYSEERAAACLPETFMCRAHEQHVCRMFLCLDSVYHSPVAQFALLPW